MAATVGDFKVAAAAAGFTLGFGFLTTWEAIKQTRVNKSPLRSTYIYMIWGEIAANLAIGIVGWLLLNGTIKPTVTTLFMGLFFWVFEIQLLMQIIINRIAIIADNKKFVKRLKIGVAVIITMINIAVFCIWIPAHMYPPPSQVYVNINKYWDRTSKVLICIVDAGLNLYFLRTVRHRIVNYYGLTKYAPLVSFNAKLMVISITLDILVIALMSLPNPIVYVQFQAAVYMSKLNIEMSMASLIAKLARGESANDVAYYGHDRTATANRSGIHDRRPVADLERSTHSAHGHAPVHGKQGFIELKAYETDSKGNQVAGYVSAGETNRSSSDSKNIMCRTDLHVVVEDR